MPDFEYHWRHLRRRVGDWFAACFGSVVDWLEFRMTGGAEPTAQVGATPERFSYRKGPRRSRIVYVFWAIVEAILYGCLLASVFFVIPFFPTRRRHSSSYDEPWSFEERLEGSLYLGVEVGGVVGPILSLGCFPVLLIIRRANLQWTRFTVDADGIQWREGAWYGWQDRVEVEPDRIAGVQPYIECTDHVEIGEHRDVVDLTLNSAEHFETFLTGLEPDEAQELADAINRVLANRGSQRAAQMLDAERL